MSREINFRIWDIQDKKMNYPKNYVLSHDWFGVTSENYLDDSFAEQYPIYQGHFALMQFTGLYDRNCREIYEGDILTDDFGSIAFVVWYDTYAQFRLDYGRDDIHLFDGQQDEMTIVGNIYENPELFQ